MLRRTDVNDVEVVLCHRSAAQLWALPKGTPDHNEAVEETAVREVCEETGLEVVITGPVDAIRYSFVRGHNVSGRYAGATGGEAVLFDKVVHFFLMRPVGGDLSLHDDEFDTVEWVDASRAMRGLTHENEVRIVEKALALFEGAAGGPPRIKD